MSLTTIEQSVKSPITFEVCVGDRLRKSARAPDYESCGGAHLSEPACGERPGFLLSDDSSFPPRLGGELKWVPKATPSVRKNPLQPVCKAESTVSRSNSVLIGLWPQVHRDLFPPRSSRSGRSRHRRSASNSPSTRALRSRGPGEAPPRHAAGLPQGSWKKIEILGSAH